MKKEYAPIQLQDEGASRGATCFTSLCALTGASRLSYGGTDSVSVRPLREQPFPFGKTGVDFAAAPPALHRPAGRWTAAQVLVSGFVIHCWADYTKDLICYFFPTSCPPPLNSSAVTCPGWLMPSRLSTFPTVMKRILISSQKVR